MRGLSRSFDRISRDREGHLSSSLDRHDKSPRRDSRRESLDISDKVPYGKTYLVIATPPSD
jgi:hypothetical protein